MVELPSQKGLETLYEKRGREALVCYAWRNALRALPFLGVVPLGHIWKKDPIRHVFGFCRVLILLGSEECLPMAASRDSSKAVRACFAALFSTSSTIDEVAAEAATVTAAAVTAVYYTANADASEAAAVAADATTAVADYSAANADASAVADYNELMRDGVSQSFRQTPLWRKEKWQQKKPAKRQK